MLSWLDVTMPATVRPEIVRRTLGSLHKHIQWSGPRRLVMNIDPAPEGADVSTMFDLLAEEAPRWNALRVNIADTPSFTRAVRWCWRNTAADWVFHLEDDWEFLQEIDLTQWLNHDYVRFMKEHAARLDRLALQPSLWRGALVRELTVVMRDDMDPEKQLRTGVTSDEVDAIIARTEMHDARGGPFCRDAGREWRAERGLEKWNKNKPTGGTITWIPRAIPA